jgi:hypothetical protein
MSEQQVSITDLDPQQLAEVKKQLDEVNSAPHFDQR